MFKLTKPTYIAEVQDDFFIVSLQRLRNCFSNKHNFHTKVHNLFEVFHNFLADVHDFFVDVYDLHVAVLRSHLYFISVINYVNFFFKIDHILNCN
jgi:hypothetical protein